MKIIHPEYRDSEEELVRQGFYKTKDEIVYVGIFNISEYPEGYDWTIIKPNGEGIILTKENAEKLGGSYSPKWLLKNIKQDKNSIEKQKKSLDNQLKELSEKENFIKVNAKKR